MSDEEQEDFAPLGAAFDLDSWEAHLPPTDFADRVLARLESATPRAAAADPAIAAAAAPVRAAAATPAADPVRVAAATPAAGVSGAPARTRRWGVITGSFAAMALAAAILFRVTAPPAEGDVIAKERIEVPLGTRALAVLEPGASVRWSGDDVVQARGDVFYRVEPGARFTVHTPAGDVEVKGTCFAVKVRPIDADENGTRERKDMQKRDVKAAAVGAAISALALVIVYEGKVAVSHAKDRVDLKAGEAAQAGPGGVKTVSASADGEKEFDMSVAAAQAGDDPLSRANQNLVRQVGEYRSRLDAIGKQKADLELKLKKSEERLVATQDGAPFTMKHDFDLSQDDWKELAKDGTVKFRVPCFDTKGGWSPSAEKLNALGLAPQDGPTLKDAYARSNERVWNALKPVCAAVVGSVEVATKIGANTCVHVVLDAERERDPEAGKRAQREVAEIRAGIRPMPGANDVLNPVAKTLLATTGAAKDFEDDLARLFGPEEARRLAYSDELCMQSSTFGGSSKRSPK